MSQIHATFDRYVVMSSASSMPNSCWGKYGHVAVLRRSTEMALAGRMPGSIRETSSVHVMSDSGPCSIGSTSRCAFERAVAYAIDRASALAERDALRSGLVMLIESELSAMTVQA